MPTCKSSEAQGAPLAGRAARRGSQAIERALLVSGAPLFQEIVESSASCVMVIEAASAGQPIVYVSPGLQALLGRIAAELIGADWASVLSARAEDPQLSALRGAVRHGSAAREIVSAHRRDGARLYLDVRLAPLGGAAQGPELRVAFLQDVTTERCARETLEYRACHDPLTGLANRYLLQDRFEREVCQAQRHGIGFTVVLLDVDGFKQINDVHGHAAGDEMLRTVGARLTGLVRGEDTVARWGGDEFVLILTETGEPDAARSALARIEQSLVRSVRPASGGFEARCSFGAAQFPADGTALDALLEIADRRLYSAKARNSEDFSVYPGYEADWKRAYGA